MSGGMLALLARWRADRGLLALVALVVALTAGVVAAVPGVLGELQRASLAAALDETTIDRAGMAAATLVPLATADADQAAARLSDLAVTVEEDLPQELRRVLGPRTAVIDSIRHDLSPLPGEPADPLARKLTWRVVEAADDAVRVLEGTLPDGVPGSTVVEGFEVELPVHQFAATRATAEALHMEVGDRRYALADTTGPVAARLVVAPDRPLVAELSAIVELTPTDAPEWFGDSRQHRAAQFDTNITTTFFAFGLVPSDALGELPHGADGAPVSLTWRFPLDVGALLRADVAVVERQVRAVRADVPVLPEEPRWTSGLDRVLAADAARRATAVEVLGLAGVGVVGVVLALVAAAGRLLAGRRREALALTRGRGASRVQLFATDVLEAVVVVGGAALLARAVAGRVVAGSADGRLVAVVAVAAALVLLAAAVPDLRRTLGDLLAERRRRAPVVHARRLAVDAVAVALGVLAVVRLRGTGVTVDGTVEPLVVAAPVALALAVAVVAARVAPLPVRALHLATRARRTLALPLGVARAARAGASGTLVVLVVLGAAVVGTSSALHRSVVTGQERAATERVGADLRIDAPPPASLPEDPPDLAGLGTVIDVSTVDATLVTGLGTAAVDVTMVDAAGLDALDVVASAELPPVSAAGGAATMAWDGTSAVPLLVSEVLRSAGSPAVGDRVALTVGEARVAGRIVGVAPRLLGRDAEVDGPFVVLDRAAWVAATGEDPGATSRLVRTDRPEEVAAIVREADDGRRVLVRAEVLEALREEPVAQGVRVGFLVAVALAALATGLGVLLVLAAAARTRRAEAAVLAALGTPGRGVVGALLAELLPVVTVAAGLGVGLTVGVVAALGGRLDLAPFTGTADASAVATPTWWVPLVVLGGATLVTALGAVATLGRVDPGRTLREAGS